MAEIKLKISSFLKDSFILIILLSLFELIAYYGFFKNIPDFNQRFRYFLIFLVISAAICAAAIRNIKPYEKQFGCMSGMMIGMTIGMIFGFLTGLVVGSTNGMFIGSLSGMIIGMAAGAWCGSCCGIMGIMEGLMAGFMGGLMGPMTTLMMLNDNLRIIIPILVFISFIILYGLDYMIAKEVKESELKLTKPNSLLSVVILSFIITMLLTWLMVYGPKSALFR